MRAYLISFFMIMGVVAFFAYDLLIDRLLVLYRYKWQTRVEKWMT